MQRVKNPFKSGFIHLLGKPNVGKSTLFNQLISTELAIATPKAQTTRQTLVGIDQGSDYQAVYVDTPGYLSPAYALQHAMMQQVVHSIPGSDVVCWMVEVGQEVEKDFFPPAWKKEVAPAFLLINKRDLLPKEVSASRKATWESVVPEGVSVRLLSAHCKADVKALGTELRSLLPVHPPYYDQDLLTDRPRAFVLSEIVRKYLLLYLHKEIPYSAEVAITHTALQGTCRHIEATIYVERESQKNIVISQLKAIGIAARKEMEAFLQEKVFLRQHVKVATKWRKNTHLLKKWGYI